MNLYSSPQLRLKPHSLTNRSDVLLSQPPLKLVFYSFKIIKPCASLPSDSIVMFDIEFKIFSECFLSEMKFSHWNAFPENTQNTN